MAKIEGVGLELETSVIRCEERKIDRRHGEGISWSDVFEGTFVELEDLDTAGRVCKDRVSNVARNLHKSFETNLVL